MAKNSKSKIAPKQTVAALNAAAPKKEHGQGPRRDQEGPEDRREAGDQGQGSSDQGHQEGQRPPRAPLPRRPD